MDEFSAVNVIQFAEARASEIASLMNDVNHIKKNATQKLPPHMRRRAASHNPRRVPRKLRKNYLTQNPNAASKPKKAPKEMRKQQQKKKHEKQAKNYPVEYASRSRPGELWLGTHIWHAKRCKMDTLWGYKLPIHCNDKKLGATHQAATKHAMLMDLSYYCCISLEGSENKLLEGLSSLTDPDSGSNFGSAMYNDGVREGHTVVYHPFKFPFEAIGPVTFIWKPVTDTFSDSDASSDTSKRCLWIWCHPSFHDEFVDVLVTIFHLEEIKNKPTTQTTLKDSNDVVAFSSKVNLEKVRQHFFREDIFVNGNVQMSLLKDKLVRHRIIGPNAQSVLANVLELADVEDVHRSTETAAADSICEINGCSEQSLLLANDNESSIRKSKKPFDDDHYPPPKRIKLESAAFINAEEYSSGLKSKSKLSKLLVNGTSSEINSEVDANHATESVHNETVDGPLMKKLKPSDESKKSEAQLHAPERQYWWKQYYSNEKARSVHKKRKKLLEHLRNSRSGYYIAPNSVIGLTVRDPRLILNRNKEKFVSTKDSDIGKDISELLTEDIADSPLWNSSIRDEVTATQIPESEINNKRAECVIPSESSNLGDKESRVPILLIHQPGTNGFGSGWDLIAPLGWSMAFWIPLVLNGGRATGIRDLHFVNLEIGKPSYPLSYPDTKAGKTNEEKQRVDELTTYFKRPKAKRPNFATFGTTNPYFMPWDVLVMDWLEELKLGESNILFPSSKLEQPLSRNFKVEISDKDLKKSFYVLRQKEVRLLQSLCERLSRLPRGNKAIREINNLKQLYNELVQSSLSSQKELKNSLVLIRTKCLTRGCPSTHSGIYALDEDDLKELKCNPNFLGPKEQNHTKGKNAGKISSDSSSVTKVQDSDDGLVKESDDSQISSSSVSKVQGSGDELVKKSDDCQICSESHADSKSLDRPVIETLKSFSSRKMIGYLSEGGFSSISGKGCGIGHCSLIGLLFVIRHYIDHQIRPVVLIREQHSFQYRVSSLEVIPNYL